MLTINLESEKKIEIREEGDKVFLNSKLFDYQIEKVNESFWIIFKGRKSYIIEIIDVKNDFFTIKINNCLIKLSIYDENIGILEKLGISKLTNEVSEEVVSPMPGRILKKFVNQGENITKGSPILVLEAMKMENIIYSPRDGKIAHIAVEEKEIVNKNQTLISFESS